MSSIFSSASSLSSYFTNSLGSSAASTSFSLSDYAQIKNGSYGKLMKAYYSKVGSKSTSTSTSATSTDATSTADALSSLTSSSSSTSKTSTSTASSTAAKTDKTTASSAQALASSLSDLSSASYTSDNIDSLYSKTADFVKNYNSTVSAGTASSVSSVNSNTSWMEGTTSSSKNLLSQVGITVNSDKTLSLDETAFKKSDLTTLKDVFGGQDSYSYGNQLGSRAQKIYSLAATGGTSDSTYTGSASYSSAASGTMYNTTV
jgi:hypothetical protein